MTKPQEVKPLEEHEIAESVHSHSQGHTNTSAQETSDYDKTLRSLMGRNQRQGCFRSDNVTKKGKRIEMAKSISLALIPVIGLAVFSALNLTATIGQNVDKIRVRNTIAFTVEVSDAIHFIQRERDITAVYLSNLGPETQMLVKDRYLDTDRAIQRMSQWPASKLSTYGFKSKKEFMQKLRDHRSRKVRDFKGEIEFYSFLINSLADWMYDAIQESRQGSRWTDLVAYLLTALAKEDFALERTLGGVFFAYGGFSNDAYLDALKSYYSGQSNFRNSYRFNPKILRLYNDEMTRLSKLKNADRVIETVDKMRQMILWRNSTSDIASELAAQAANVQKKSETQENATQGEITAIEDTFKSARIKVSTWWYDNMTIYIDIIFGVQQKIVGEILMGNDVELQADKESLIGSIVLLVLVVLFSPFIIVSLGNIVRDMQKYAVAVIEQTRVVNKERKQAEGLIYQMLPKPIAKALKANQTVKTETFEEASVFFCDVVGFTRISADCSPMQVVNMLNKLYICFDSRIIAYDVHKIETIGDGYMVASGVPRRVGKNHVNEAAMCSIDLQHAVRHVEIPHLPGQTMKLRIGIHTGPVVAGVVGQKMPRYCLFGETVTIASLLEANSIMDKIQISEITYACLQQFDGYKIEKRGDIELKDKGSVTTYFLVWKKGIEDRFPCGKNCRIGMYKEE